MDTPSNKVRYRRVDYRSLKPGDILLGWISKEYKVVDVGSMLTDGQKFRVTEIFPATFDAKWRMIAMYVKNGVDEQLTNFFNPIDFLVELPLEVMEAEKEWGEYGY